MSAMSRYFLMASLMLLSACCDREHHFRVTGVDGEFCIPDTGYVAPGVWFVPPDSPGVDEGFSFGGCHRLDNEKNKASCFLPKNFISADVFSLKEKRGIKWRDLKKTADFGVDSSKSDNTYVVDYKAGLLVLSGVGNVVSWSIWKAQQGPGVADFIMNDGDELVATCSMVSDFPRSAGLGAEGEYGCSRYVRGPKYALEYRFISKERVPGLGKINSLDEAIFSQVDSWRCSGQ
ncbi:hypothetical protein NB712_002955 [Xanthomonas sacchari]|nr:hypothetical protein [Xanthomonas sacchari]